LTSSKFRRLNATFLGNRTSPTAVRAEPVAWNGDLMTAGPTYRLHRAIFPWVSAKSNKDVSS